VEVLRTLTQRVVAARAAKAAADAAELRSCRSQALRPRGAERSDLAVREIAAELAAAVRASDRTIQARMDDAVMALGRFGATVDALGKGAIERRTQRDRRCGSHRR
jgi:hypothetical protein